jgi:hypothetical protein
MSFFDESGSISSSSTKWTPEKTENENNNNDTPYVQSYSTLYMMEYINSLYLYAMKFVKRQLQMSEIISLLWRIPILIFYFSFLWIPLICLGLIKFYIIVIIKILCRRSPSLNKLRKQILEFYKSLLKLYRNFQKKSLEDVVIWVMHTIFEVIAIVTHQYILLYYIKNNIHILFIT